MKTISKIALACAALAAASGAFAQKAGDNIISAGVATISTDASVGTLTHSNPGITPALIGTSATISEESTLSLGWLHMFTDNVGAEFTIGVPPTVTQNLTTPNTPSIGLPASHQGAATLAIWTPTAVGKFFCGTANDKFRPYIGFGASRVSFHNIKTSAGVATLAGTSADLSSSWAPVYNAGMIYNIDEKWVINGSVAYIPVTTTATFVGSTGTTIGDIKLNTTDYVIRLGYKF